MLRNVESLVMMLSSAYLFYFSPLSSGGLIMILCSYLTDTCNKHFGTNCGPAFPSIDHLRQFLAIGDRTT